MAFVSPVICVYLVYSVNCLVERCLRLSGDGDLTHTAVLPRVRNQRNYGRRISAITRRVVQRVSVPSSVRNLAQMPLTVMGVGSTVAGIALVCLPAALIVLGPVLIGLEFMIADD